MRDPPEETCRSCKCQLGKNHWAEGSRWAKGLGQDGARMLEHGGGLCGWRGGESRAGTVGCREDLGLGPEEEEEEGWGRGGSSQPHFNPVSC